MKREFDQHQDDKEFEVDVWFHLSQQLSITFFKSFILIQRLIPFIYKVDVPQRSLIHPDFHASFLKKNIALPPIPN